jgi:hypothetical protein
MKTRLLVSLFLLVGFISCESPTGNLSNEQLIASEICKINVLNTTMAISHEGTKIFMVSYTVTGKFNSTFVTNDHYVLTPNEKNGVFTKQFTPVGKAYIVVVLTDGLTIKQQLELATMVFK